MGGRQIKKHLWLIAVVFVLIGVSFACGCGGETGEGTITILGGTYTGQLVNGVAEGYGIWEHPNGKSYEGEFKDGVQHGQGTFTFADRTMVKGRWENGEYVGE